MNKTVSFTLFTYNHERYIKDSVISVLNQSYSPLEIIISDDCSTDKTFDIIKTIIKEYSGPHKVILNRNEKNLGIGAHVTKVLYEIASGEYIVMLAGDDISKKYHVEEAVSLLNQYNDVSLIDFSADFIDENGSIIKRSASSHQITKYTINDYLVLNRVGSFSPGRIFKRSLIEFFEPISEDCPTEDFVLVLRSLLQGGFYRIDNSLVYYRKHYTSLSNFKIYSKLSHYNIIKQFERDIIHSLKNKLITKYIFDILIKRISLDLKIKNIKYKNKYKLPTYMNQLFIKLSIKYLRFKYIISLPKNLKG